MNRLFYGDNLDILRRKVASNSVDLCYIDPPFNSKRNYFQIYNNQGAEDRAQAQAFVDTWSWGEDASEGLAYILDLERLTGGREGVRWTEQTVALIRGLEPVLGRGSLLAYLVHMTLRIVEIHRVLKATRSFYLHCDPTASHYLKLVLDAVFVGQGGDYLNEIVWKRSDAHNDGAQGSQQFGRVHDTIFFYAKGRNRTWNPQHVGLSQKTADSWYRNIDADGRRYNKADLTAAKPGGNVSYGWAIRRKAQTSEWVADVEEEYKTPHPDWVYQQIVPPAGRFWAYSVDNMRKFSEMGRLVYSASGRPYMKRFLEDSKGVSVQDFWDDISMLRGIHKHNDNNERLGYPTQKPEALLERIIRASSNEGDTVLDAYCGCGTSVAVAQRLGRRWIGIDITYQSIALILKRLQDTHPKDWAEVEANILLDGVPKDLASAMALAHRKDDKTRKEFEKWAVLTYSRNQARINDKKGADGGIDGVAYFLKDKGENGKAVFQVKSRPGTREDLAKLNSDRQREGAEFGILLCTGPPAVTKAMQGEIAAAGRYQNPLLQRSDDRLQVVMIAELFAPHNRRLDLPMARDDALRTARALGDAGRQVTLDL